MADEAAKIEYRAKPQDCILLSNSDVSLHAVRTTYPLRLCLNNKFLINCRHQFKAGDIIVLQRYTNDKLQSIVEFCPMVQVTAVDNTGVDIVAPFAIVDAGKPGEAGIVVDRGISNQFVIRVDGAVHGARNTVVEANEYAQMLADETGKPVRLMDAKKKAA